MMLPEDVAKIRLMHIDDAEENDACNEYDDRQGDHSAEN
jgi:hypothetical protein